MSAFLSCADPLALVFFPSNCCLKTHLWLVFIVAVTCHCMVEVTRTPSKLESGSSGFSDEAASALSLAALIWFQQEPRWVSSAKDPPAAVISHPRALVLLLACEPPYLLYSELDLIGLPHPNPSTTVFLE